VVAAQLRRSDFGIKYRSEHGRRISPVSGVDPPPVVVVNVSENHALDIGGSHLDRIHFVQFFFFQGCEEALHTPLC
jgi:hypothetical protein